jgi:hypothetical protein
MPPSKSIFVWGDDYVDDRTAIEAVLESLGAAQL